MDRLVVAGDSVNIKQSRGLFNIEKISNWKDIQLDLFRTAYMCIQTDRTSALPLILGLLFWGGSVHTASRSA